jgi:hypothetical protein
MTWVMKSSGFQKQQARRLSLEESRRELEALGISVIESELRVSGLSHRIGAKDWHHQAKELLAAGFVPRPDNDAGRL